METYPRRKKTVRVKKKFPFGVFSKEERNGKSDFLNISKKPSPAPLLDLGLSPFIFAGIILLLLLPKEIKNDLVFF
ncbi:hypothetical protein LEP1GSC116_0850 [Leptospira interrogans serovar Icterohaemorrhagiae str. Verdun HP]|uniref:Uncharacterized protein n=1 Tax=Leptospira interrogans serovar Icterohaemorrhagiae str. Verdun HP TaxID=1049910 RepID=M6RAA4_LEPIR|nr:hypothetical protein LEP1GSC116_0850 [Leptospira interrogans serovar Icterohaemorrhagiae str. Verdun HP]